MINYQTSPFPAQRILLFLAGAVLCAPSVLFAQSPGQGSTPVGSAFAEACAGIGFSSPLQPGNAWVPGINGAGGATICNSASGAAPNQGASNTGVKAPYQPYADNASATGTIGQLHLQATHSGNTSYFLPEAYADAGWNDLVTAFDPLNPLLPNGTAGVMVSGIQVSGNFTAAGPSSLTSGFVEIFQNGGTVTANDAAAYAAFLALNPNAVSNGCSGPAWSPEMVGWGASSRTNTCQTVNANTTVWFVLPVTIGQQYQIGIWADISAGEGSDAGTATPVDGPQDTASADMSHTILWAGTNYFISGGQTYTDVTLTSASGFNYNVAATDTAAVPEPSTTTLLPGGVVILALALRRRIRANSVT
jgi:hypothetical protein